MQSKLSVIVPVFNVAEFLPRCLDSILAQTYPAFDIVAVDDGSTDGSGEICEAYAARDDRIRVMHKENGGQTSARKVGLRHADARAPFVTFVDSDDWIEPWAFAEMMQAAEAQSVACVIAGHLEDTGASSREVLPDFPEGRYDRARMEREFLPYMMGRKPFFTWGIFTSLCNKVFLKSVLSDVLLAEDERIALGEDTAAVFPALFHASSIYILHRSYYHYIQKRQSMVKKIGEAKKEREQYAALYDFVKGRIPQNVRGGVDISYAVPHGTESRYALCRLGRTTVSLSISECPARSARRLVWCGDVWTATLAGDSADRHRDAGWMGGSECGGASGNRLAGRAARGDCGNGCGRHCCGNQSRSGAGRGAAGSSAPLSREARACVGCAADLFGGDAKGILSGLSHLHLSEVLGGAA